MAHELHAPIAPPGATAISQETGAWAWRNPRNRFRCLTLHYTIDPAKRAVDWAERESGGMPTAEWNREYELAWTIFAGRAVYPDYKESWHVARQTLQPLSERGYIITGWDCTGLNQATAVVQVLPGPRVRVLDEFILDNGGVTRHLDYCAPEISLKYRWWIDAGQHLCVIDPRGFARAETDERAAADLLRMPPWSFGPIPGEVSLKRIDIVSRYLVMAPGGEPAILISPHLERLIGGFRGGYHRKQMPSGSYKDVPEKNEFSHIHEALQYAMSRLDVVSDPIPYATGPLPTAWQFM